MGLNNRIEHYQTADQILGSKESRYFGNGYKCVHYQTTNVIVIGSIVSATTSINYPEFWSKKDKRTDLIPHLSTIDATYISLQLCEAYLVSSLMLNDEERNGLFIKTLKLRSGESPSEDLSNIPASLDYVTVKHNNCDTHIFSGQVGNIKVSLEVETVGYPAPVQISNQIVYKNIESVLGDSNNRYFGKLYEKSEHHILNVVNNVNDLASSAEISVENNYFDNTIHYGIDTDYITEFTPSIIDCIAVIAQLSQVLIYDIDSLQRGKSNTLWMRKIEIHRSRKINKQFECSTIKVKKTKILKMRNNDWRLIDLTGSFYNYQFEYSLAHMLPKKGE